MAEATAGQATRDAGFVGLLAGFARELRAAGVAVGTGDILAYCAAMEPLDPTDLLDLYWAGRATLVSKRDDIAVYDEVFRRFFLGGADPVRELITLKARVEAEAEAVLAAPATSPDPEGEREEAVLGWMASDVEALKRKSFAACTPEELAALRRIMTRIRLTPPRRRTRRTVPARSGRQPDLRRTVRESLRLHGDPAQLSFRQRRVKLRPLILILDISGSMADYSRNLLQFAYSASRAAARVEVFCFGTRLTRMTKALASPAARRRAGARRAARCSTGRAGPGSASRLDTFVRDWGRRGLCRGGVVVICSDGLDRGDPAVLAAAMERLSRLCHTLVWMNPHKGNDPDFRPSTLGMMAAAPHIDRAAVRARPGQPGRTGGAAADPELDRTPRDRLNGPARNEREEHPVRWSVGIEAEGDRVLTREQVVELADAVAASSGIATGHRHQPLRRPAGGGGSQPGGRDRAGHGRVHAAPRPRPGCRRRPIVRAEAVSEVEEIEP